jgi:hypothetical protein
MSTEPPRIRDSGSNQRGPDIRSSGWNFATNYRAGRFGIVSTARLHGMPIFSGANPEIYAVRVRKEVTKNLAMLHYPLELSSDATSAIASSTFSPADFDEMGENFAGEYGSARSVSTPPPCVTIVQHPDRRQSWRIDCSYNPPEDSQFETFTTDPGIPLLVMSRTDFLFDGEPSFGFVRKYRPQDDRSRSFGIGATDSFDIFPVGESSTFSSMELILADGARIHYKRTSAGEGYADAKLRANSYMGNPFSLSSLGWNGNGWGLQTNDGWTYRFPSSGPGKTWQQSALIGARSASGATFAIQRDGASDLQEIRGPQGDSIKFTSDAMHRIVSAQGSAGRAMQYEYDTGGRLAHIHASKNGDEFDEFYEYNPANQLTSVLDAHHRPVLINTYGALGEIRSQTLANGEKILYESGYDEHTRLTYLKLTLPNGYLIQWQLTKYGFVRSWPQAPAGIGSASHW